MRDVAFDAKGNLYIADTANHRIRKVAVPDAVAPVVSIVSPVDASTVTVGASLSASYSCSDTGGSLLVSCVGIANGSPVASGDLISTSSAGDVELVVTGTDCAGNMTAVSATVTVSSDRAVTAMYTEEEFFNIGQAAEYLGLEMDVFQQHGVAVLRFINALVGNVGPAPLGQYAPVNEGPRMIASSWSVEDQVYLDWVGDYYVVPDEGAQKTGVVALYFLASLNAGQSGTPFAEYMG